MGRDCSDYAVCSNYKVQVICHTMVEVIVEVTRTEDNLKRWPDDITYRWPTSPRQARFARFAYGEEI